MEKKSYANMAEVVKQDEYCNKFFFIEDGELECRMGFTRVTREGNKKKVDKFDPKLVKVYYPGDCFGELNLIYTIPSRGNVGDSRCIMSCDNGKIQKDVTRDHKPEFPYEKERIYDNEDGKEDETNGNDDTGDDKDNEDGDDS